MLQLQLGMTNDITNMVEFICDPGYPDSVKLLTSGNDGKVRIFNLEKEDYAEPEAIYENKEPINIAKFNADHSLLAVYGDCYPAHLYDPRIGKIIDILFGHEDFGFALSWHPAGHHLATGNQDLTVKIWDMRKLGGGSAAAVGSSEGPTGSGACVNTIAMNTGASHGVEYADSGRMLVVSESIDFLHVFDAEEGLYDRRQELDFFGSILGFTVIGERAESIFLGLADPELSCLVELEKAGMHFEDSISNVFL